MDVHRQLPDGGVWEHRYFWLGSVVAGSVLVAGFFLLGFLDLTASVF